MLCSILLLVYFNPFLLSLLPLSSSGFVLLALNHLLRPSSPQVKSGRQFPALSRPVFLQRSIEATVVIESVFVIRSSLQDLFCRLGVNQVLLSSTI